MRVSDGSRSAGTDVVGHLVNGSDASVLAAADLLNQSDVAIVQHEYGVYGGTDGDEVLRILDRLRVPSMVVAHTVLLEPSPHQREILVMAARMAGTLIVMSQAARRRLCTRFDIAPEKVTVIPHGATLPAGAARTHAQARPTILTAGLIGPGKGIRRVIDALPALHGLASPPEYLVAGQTHPKVLAYDGESYREALAARARQVGVADCVSFDSSYRDVASQTALLRSAAVVVLPYDSTDQVTSGVLVDAVAAGRPVVATAFPHAVELLATGAGIVVDHDDPDALAEALLRVFTEPGLAAGMASEAARLAPSMSWPVVASAYMRYADQLLDERVAVG